MHAPGKESVIHALVTATKVRSGLTAVMPSSVPATKEYHYERHKPEETVLYKIIQENLASFLEEFAQETRHQLPDFVVKEFTEYLQCGILAPHDKHRKLVVPKSPGAEAPANYCP